MDYKTDTIALKKAMLDRGIETALELSEKTGINRNTVGDILRGKTQPTSTAMYRIAEVLSIEPADAGRIFFSHDLRSA